LPEPVAQSIRGSDFDPQSGQRKVRLFSPPILSDTIIAFYKLYLLFEIISIQDFKPSSF
jgi:hypothetical protein